MSESRKKLGLGVLLGSPGGLALLGIAGLAGAYDVAAAEDHASFTRWAFHATMHRSVSQRAADNQAARTVTPAFGAGHDDKTLWGVAAFVKELPAVTPERYAALGGGNPEGHQGTSGGASSGGGSAPSTEGTSGAESGNAGRQGE